MNTQKPHTHTDQTARKQLEAEIDAVRDHVIAAVTDLGSPFSELVRPRFRAADPPLRAALALCAGYNGPNGDPLHRIYLAAALEMLHVALGIHQLLVDAASSNPLSQPAEDYRSFIGSTILAGDYCFSRAAQMAAKTENPQIVASFAQALQDISESRLRQLFSNQDGSQPAQRHERDEILLRSGATAAFWLSDLPSADRPALLALTDSTIDYALSAEAPKSPCSGPLDALPATHRQRWRAFCDWLITASDAAQIGQAP